MNCEISPKVKMFAEFCESQGISLVDAETGEKIITKEVIDDSTRAN